MKRLLTESLLDQMTNSIDRSKVGHRDEDVFNSTQSYLRNRVLPAIRAAECGWSTFQTFWPPRLLNAFADHRLCCFYGAGLSMPSGLPSWADMLRDFFGLEPNLVSDDDLQSDPLTQAELAAHRLGADEVQALLRRRLGDERPASTTHLLAAALRLPLYITTNYDELFERAWGALNSAHALEVITNDSDLTRLGIDLSQKLEPNVSYLFKIHGSTGRPYEHLILTRSDYRRHYRVNRQLFTTVTNILSTYHTLFIGFGHRDPEVTRLVDDAIWEFEKNSGARATALNGSSGVPARPHLYSLQFSKHAHTPEIYAARGMVALEPPPVVDVEVRDIRSCALARALADLIGSAEKGLGQDLSLDGMLQEFSDAIAGPLSEALDKMELVQSSALDLLTRASNETPQWMVDLRKELGPLAGQGLYLLDDQGQFSHASLPGQLSAHRRADPTLRFGQRPYFRQARTYRVGFVSESFRSIFNGNATIALCQPVLGAGRHFMGLLFSACQVGAWQAPVTAATRVWTDKLAALVVDANGVALLPPHGEFEPGAPAEFPTGERVEENVGYSYDRLVATSRRDKVISRVMENIVPLAQDDDVMSLGGDIKQYTVVAHVARSRWKIGVSESVFLHHAI